MTRPSLTVVRQGTESPMREDRAAELGDFISALFEWGAHDDPHDIAEQALSFLRSPVGLEEYREHQQ